MLFKGPEKVFSKGNVLDIISSLGTHITKLSIPPPKFHPISKDIRFQCLLFHQMDIEFFAQILFVKILGPHELCLTLMTLSWKNCRIMQPDVFNISVEAKKLGTKKQIF